MKIKSFFLLIILFIASSCTQKKENTNAPEHTIENPLISFRKHLYQNKIDSLVKKFNFNGSISVYEDTILLAQKNSGYENFERKIPVTERTVFAIGSISKQFTAVMVLRLTEKGSLKLSDSVFHYLKDFDRKGFRNVTITELLNHTSGISDSGDGLISAPGREFNYSNKGFYSLGKIIEKVTGKSFEENAASFFQEIGFQHTFTPKNFNGIDFGSAYIGVPSKPQPVAEMPLRLSKSDISTPAGGILSTTSDLHLWNQKLYGGKIISTSSLAEFTQERIERPHPIFGKMGYGFGIMMDPKTPTCYFHSGYVKGSPSLNLYFPETKTSVIILSNIADEHLGKKEIFRTHLEMKKTAHSIETAYLQTLLTKDKSKN